MIVKVLEFKLYLAQTLGGDKYETLPALLGMTDYRFNWLMNEREDRTARWSAPEIMALSHLLSVDSHTLRKVYGLGMSNAKVVAGQPAE